MPEIWKKFNLGSGNDIFWKNFGKIHKFWSFESRNFWWSLSLEVLTRYPSRLHHYYLVLPIQKQKHNWNWSATYFILSIRFNKILLFRMVSKRLKLHQFFDLHEIFPTHKHAELHQLAKFFDNTNAVSNHEKVDQIVRGVFCQIFTKSCQIHCEITNNIAKILKKILHKFSIKRFSLTMNPIPTVLLRCI